jgi:Protein of unknown function (DUF4038)/Putative collagen-binding domain of a collagenase
VHLPPVPVAPTPPVKSRAHGLKISDNQRYLVRPDGTPFSWFADTAWELFHRLKREEAAFYLSKRQEQGFTLIQAVILAEFQGVRTPNAYGDCALVHSDPTQLNEPYFRHVDWIVNQANQSGLVVGLLPTWGDKVGETHGDGPRIFTATNARVYGEILGRRYCQADLVWILGGDRSVDDKEKQQIWRAMGAGLREGDRGAHLLTFHPRGGDDLMSTSASTFPNSDPFLDFNMRQNGHSDRTKTWQRIEDDYTRKPVKPVIDGEPLYEDHPIGFDAANQGYSNAHDTRRYLYLDLFAGAFGHTYGHHTIWQFHAPGRGEGVNHPLGFWRDALDSPGVWQIRHARALVESRPFLSRIPDNNLIVISDVPEAVPGTGTRRIGATRDREGRYGMVYSASSRRYVVRTDSLGGERLHFWWFDPRDGTHLDLGVFQKRPFVEVNPPRLGEDQDIVLVIDDVDCRFPPPGSSRASRWENEGEIRLV